MRFPRIATFLCLAVLISFVDVSASAQGVDEPAAAAPESANAANDQAPEQADEKEVDLAIYDVRTPHLDRPLKVVEFEAPAIGRMTKYMVLLPEGYDDHPDKRYPVLYLLHGFSQNYTVWPIMGLAQHAAPYDLIVVMPDAGNSWFINWAESEDGQLNNWEDFIVYDLIHSVDDYFRTIPTREGRAIGGVSMGGYGAVMIGLRHPTMFCSVSSESGVLDYARNAWQRLDAGEPPKPNEIPPPRHDPREENVPEVIEIPGFTKQHERYPHGTAFTTVEGAKEYDPFELIKVVPVKYLPHIYLDCGLGDSLITVNQEFAALLMSNGIPFAYGQTPGGHGANYWSREMATSMAVQWAVIDRNVKLWEMRQAEQAAEAVSAAPEEEHAAPELPPGDATTP